MHFWGQLPQPAGAQSGQHAPGQVPTQPQGPAAPGQVRPTEQAQRPPRQVTFDDNADLDVPDFLK